MKRSLALLVAAVLVVGFSPSGEAASDIGVAAAVNNSVKVTLGPSASRLSTGDRVYQNERVDTEEASSAQLLFRDETALTVGPSSSVVLDRFVYNPATRTGDIVFSSARGAFRFVSGSATSSSYKVLTPVASIGVRGTIWSWFIRADGSMVAVCEEGSIEACNKSGQCIVAGPGEAIVFGPDGEISGPVDWSGALWEVVDGVPFPLFGRRFENDFTDHPTPVSPSDLNDAIDNLEDRTPPSEEWYDVLINNPD